MNKQRLLFLCAITFSATTMVFSESLAKIAQHWSHTALLATSLRAESAYANHFQLQVVNNTEIIELPENTDIYLASTTAETDSLFVVNNNDQMSVIVVTSKGNINDFYLATLKFWSAIDTSLDGSI